MPDARVQRRLAAIMAADVVGYSRLMGEDETGTLATLKAHRPALIDPVIAEHHGRIVKLMGDGVLVEFASVVDAVECAVAIQNGMVGRNADAPERQRILFRIGVNIGDIIIDGDDVYGDGANVAARLEALAEPGGICMGRNVRDEIRDKLDVPLVDLGEIAVKNIARPVRAFRVASDGRAPAAAPWWRTKLPILATTFVLLAAIAGGGAWWWLAQQQGRGSTDAAEKAAVAALPLPDKPSIAVMPFENMSTDKDQTYFADGMTEDIITDLSKISGLFVIARNSSFQYRGKDVDVKTVGRELGVRYLLEGSVRKAGNQIRINAQLIDARSGNYLWGDRYDGTLSAVFALQDRITGKIVEALSVTLSAGERAATRQVETTVPEAYDTFLAAWQHYRARTVEDYRAALPLLEKAVTLDPGYGRAWATLASIYNEAGERAWLGQLGIDAARLPSLLAEALKHPTPLAYQVQYERLMGRGNRKGAEAALDKASALDPEDADTLVMRSGLEAVSGNVDTAIALMKTAMRLDPHYPAYDLYILGWHYLRASDTAKAIDNLERAVTRNPDDWFPLIYLTAAYVRADRMDDARRTAKSLIQRRKQVGFYVTVVGSFANWWTMNGAFGEQVLSDLGKAGIPAKVDPAELHLPPADRLSEAELKAAANSASRTKGRIASGTWMKDTNAQGNSVYYWNGSRTGTAMSQIRGDKVYNRHNDGREDSCAIYRNPRGTKAGLDEFIAVCTNGVYTYARFPLPEAAR